MFKVCIGTPTRGNMRAETVAWLLQTFARLRGNCLWLPVIEKRGVVHNRNKIVMSFLKTDCTHLFFLDSDNVPHPSTIEKLLEHDLPFVSAPSEQIINGEHGVLVLDRDDKNDGYKQHRPFTPGSGLQKCDVVGGAGMMIRRDVLENINPPWFMEQYDEFGLIKKGEDFNFCETLHEMGIDVFADCDMLQKHIMTV